MTGARLGSVNEFCWMHLRTRDLPGTAAFFSAVLGWHFAPGAAGAAGAPDSTGMAGTPGTADGCPVTGVSVAGHRIGSAGPLAAPPPPPDTDPGTGAAPHVTYYLAVDEVDARIEAATSTGARLVVPPFDAGGQGRTAMLVDPLGAPFALWQPYAFAGWNLPPRTPGAPLRMVLASEQPDRARHFYREVLGASLAGADFLPARGPGAAPPAWELAVGVTDPDAVAAAARAYGRPGAVSADGTDAAVRVTGPGGLGVLVGALP